MNNTKKRLIENFFSLSLLQIANYILPLITIPYLVRVLGPEKFGLVSFAQAFIQYFVIITDYGFHLTATRKISLYRNQTDKINEIFSSVFAAKIFLCFLSLLLLLVVVFSIEKFRVNWLLYFVTFGIVAGNMLFPVWLFQGMEQMKYITYINVSSKAIFTFFIFIIVKSEDHYLRVAFLNSAGYLFSGIISLYVVSTAFGIRPHIPKWVSVKEEMKDGFYVFLSFIGERLYTTSNIFILGLLTSNTAVGYYSAGERLVKALQGLFQPVSQVIYPHISYTASQSLERTLKFIRKIIYSMGGTFGLASVLLFVFSKDIVLLLYGTGFENTESVMRIMSFLPFVGVMGNIFGTQIMLNFNMQSTFARIIICGSLIHIPVSLFLTNNYGMTGMATSVMITETILAISMFVMTIVKGINVFEIRAKSGVFNV